MVDNIPSEYNVSTLYSFVEFKDGFNTSTDGCVTEKGYCPCCENNVDFENHRTHITLKGLGLVESNYASCPNCGSTARGRNTVNALNTFFPG